jgi:hypothetical protein
MVQNMAYRTLLMGKYAGYNGSPNGGAFLLYISNGAFDEYFLSIMIANH